MSPSRRLRPSLHGALVVIAVEIAAMVMEITAVVATVMLDVALPRRSDARVVCESRTRGCVSREREGMRSRYR